MAHRLNTNKQFMVGNGILAFAVIFVVVIFIYMSMRLQQKQQEERHFIETYTISLVKGFTGDSISLFVNDSLISNKTIIKEPYTVEVGRFAEQSALLIVDNKTMTENQIVGGARTKAFKKLVSEDAIFAVLMKTQEGLIQFNKQGNEER